MTIIRPNGKTLAVATGAAAVAAAGVAVHDTVVARRKGEPLDKRQMGTRMAKAAVAVGVVAGGTEMGSRTEIGQRAVNWLTGKSASAEGISAHSDAAVQVVERSVTETATATALPEAAAACVVSAAGSLQPMTDQTLMRLVEQGLADQSHIGLKGWTTLARDPDPKNIDRMTNLVKQFYQGSEGISPLMDEAAREAFSARFANLSLADLKEVGPEGLSAALETGFRDAAESILKLLGQR